MKKHNIIQGTPEWHQLRKGKITGTTLKDIMGTAKTRKNAFYEILAERLTIGVPEDYENAAERGLRLEPEAVAMFELETGKSVELVGFCEDDDEPSMGNSPDGLIGETEAVEVKCLMPKYHVKMWLENKLPDEYPHDYMWQIIQYFVVNKKLKTLYFISYNPDVPIHPLHVVLIKRKDIEKQIEKAETEEKAFIKEINEKLKELITI